MSVYGTGHATCDDDDSPWLHMHSSKVKLSMKIIQQHFFHEVLDIQQRHAAQPGNN